MPFTVMMLSNRNSTPEMKTINIALPKVHWNAPQPPIRPPTMEFNPMPGACANGNFAKNAINKVPTIAPSAVATNTDSCRAASEPAIWFGFTTKMYAIARKVTIPAMISVRTLLPAAEMPKNLSSFFPITILLLKLFIQPCAAPAEAAAPYDVLKKRKTPLRDADRSRFSGKNEMANTFPQEAEMRKCR